MATKRCSGLSKADAPFRMDNAVVSACTISPGYGIDTDGDLSSQHTVAKNNISYNNITNYSDFFYPSSTNNLSGPTQTNAPGSNPQNAKTITFVDATNKDFHLAPTDTSARGAGTNLSADPNLAFNNDIDGFWRFNIWDIGADQLQDIFISLRFLAMPFRFCRLIRRTHRIKANTILLSPTARNGNLLLY